MQTAVITGLATVALLAYSGNTHNGALALVALALPFVVWAWHLRRKR